MIELFKGISKIERVRPIRYCYYCPDEPGLIFDRLDATRMQDGSWKCNKCMGMDIRKMMI